MLEKGVRVDFPTTAFGAGIVVTGLLPGVVFTGVRAWIRGFSWSDQTLAARILTAIVVSVILDSVYFSVFGELVAPLVLEPRAEIARNPHIFGLVMLVCVGAIPAALALALHFRPVWYQPTMRWWPDGLRMPRRPTAFESTPTAWDKKVAAQADTWIKIQYPDGRRVAGWFSGESFVSTYPQPRDIFIQEQFEIDETGRIGTRVDRTAGVWLTVDDGCIVEWLNESSGERTRDGRE